MSIFLVVAQIIISLALIAVLLLQVKGGGLGGIFGQCIPHQARCRKNVTQSDHRADGAADNSICSRCTCNCSLK
jgi:hypothetical protein